MGSHPTDPPAAVVEAIADLNRAADARWVLGGPLRGGRQSGAWAIGSADGVHAVLKTASPDWAEQMRRAAPAVRMIRGAGYPTPAWIAAGTTQSGVGYQVQERVAGAPTETIDAGGAAVLVALLDRHAGLDPDPDRCWNDFVAAELGPGRGPLFDAARRSGPDGERLVEVCERFASGARPEEWPRTDLVHGDLRPANVLVADGRVTGVVDIEALGSGTRAFDHATLLSSSELDDAAVRRVALAGASVAGPAVLLACIAQVFADLVRFTRGRDGDEAAAATATDLLRRTGLIEHVVV